MKTIHKFPLDSTDGFHYLPIPATAWILNTAFMGNNAYIWVMLDTAHAVEKPRLIVNLKTGVSIPDGCKMIQYVGTLINDVGVVDHIFEVGYEYRS